METFTSNPEVVNVFLGTYVTNEIIAEAKDHTKQYFEQDGM